LRGSAIPANRLVRRCWKVQGWRGPIL